MKKILLFLLCLLTSITLIACDKDDSSSNNENDDSIDTDINTDSSDLPESDEDLGFTIHYDQTTMSGDKYKWNLWLWEKGKDGADYQFNGEDNYGVYYRVKWSDFSTTAEASSIGFIVKENKVWAESPTKDIEDDRYIDFSSLTRDKYGYYNVYLKYDDETIYTSATGEVNDMISYFDLAYNEKTGFSIWFQTNKEFSDYEIKLGNNVILSNTVGTDKITSSQEKRMIFSLGTELPSIINDYTLSVTFKDSGKTLTKTADKSVLYKTKEFDELYTYDGELGAIYSKESTTFRVWSPVSTSMILRIYDTGTPKSYGGADGHQEYVMTKGEKGTWEYTINGDMAGKYYTYVVTNSSYKNQEVVDPYAKSTGLNGLRGMVVDFSVTNPDGWDDVTINEYSSTELTVYETHIADLTSSSTWGGTASNAKLYTGFYETGTTYTENGVTVTTGFDHIKELGVNAVQILPIFDQANDERTKTFNWGYNPLNYNSLDGIYSSNPQDGYTKIKEFKELVKAYNEAGINIIMDVVYNHVNSLEGSNFDVLMPKYYFRYTTSGASNGSGCGNETASEMPMFRKFMIDSTEFWASEYKLGGFRFDLMGIHDVETMNELAENLHTNVSEYITVYGEPWSGGTIALSSDYTSAKQSAMNKFEGYGCFNDQMRDALIKGGLSSDSEKGWITNSSSVSSGDVTKIKNGIKGLILSGNSTLEPEKCVNYVTCHDNYTLYDRIKAAGIKDEDTIKKMAMLANSVVFTSQGITFMLSGEEFLRTKGGNSNSYNSSYKVNELDYSLKIKNYDMFKNYQLLIQLKHNSNILGKSSTDCKNITINTNSDSSMIYYDLVDTVNNVTYRIVHSNGVSSAEKVVDLSGYTLYLDTLNKEDLTLSENTSIDAYQTIIAYKSLS